MAADAETVTIVIHPSGVDADDLSVADAMQQVLDAFQILSNAQVKDVSDPASVVWRLKKASTNSPLTIVASAYSSLPEVPIARQAVQAVMSFQNGLESILHAESKPLWVHGPAEDAFRRVLSRNLNGIGRTEIITKHSSTPVAIDHRSAKRALNFLEKVAAEEALQIVDMTHKEYGSVDGYVSEATTWHDRPAFRIRARLTGKEIICVLPKQSAEEVGDQHKWSEVFKKERVLVSGLCFFNTAGVITRIDADSVTPIRSQEVSISDLRKNGDHGVDINEHLRLTWGDEGG